MITNGYQLSPMQSKLTLKEKALAVVVRTTSIKIRQDHFRNDDNDGECAHGRIGGRPLLMRLMQMRRNGRHHSHSTVVPADVADGDADGAVVIVAESVIVGADGDSGASLWA